MAAKPIYKNLRLRVAAWVALNHGVCAKIAQQADCTSSFVNLVLYGQKRSKDGKVERLLRKAGAPINVR